MATLLVAVVGGVGKFLVGNALALMGFGELGPIAGSLAAAWQATIGGFVGAGSVFAYFQGLGMTLGATVPILPAALALPAAAPALPAVGAGGAVLAGLAALLF